MFVFDFTREQRSQVHGTLHREEGEAILRLVALRFLVLALARYIVIDKLAMKNGIGV